MPLDTDQINLEKASVMLIDGNHQGLEILTQVFAGFGVRTPHRCSTVSTAIEQLRRFDVDLIVAEADLTGEMDGYDFVHSLRRSRLAHNAFTSVILISGHTRARNVARARDCGANFIVAKPITPAILLRRVIWVARENRQFVECETYFGPDRRFNNLGAPPGVKPRRCDDAGIAAKDAPDKVSAMPEPNRAPS